MFDANAKKAGIITTFFVQIILPFSYETQIASPVVKRVPVFMVNNLTLLRVHYEPGERNITRRFFAKNNNGAAIRRNTHRSDAAIIFSVRRVTMNVKDFTINIGVDFDNPALDFERQIIDFAFWGHNKTPRKRFLEMGNFLRLGSTMLRTGRSGQVWKNEDLFELTGDSNTKTVMAMYV